MPALPSVPDPSDPRVLALLRLHGLANAPVLISVKNFHYAKRMCHLSSKHHAMQHGGSRVHGWALWRWNIPDACGVATVVIAEHHSVWQGPSGELIDVTPPLGGGTMVLFVRDDDATIGEKDGLLIMHVDRTNLPWCPTLFEGKPTGRSHWTLHPNTLEIVSYAASLKFDLVNLPT